MIKKKVIIAYMPLFYGYGKVIKSKLEESGNEVLMIIPIQYRFLRFLCAFLPVSWQNKCYGLQIQNSLEKIDVKRCDYFFVIKGEYLDISHILYLKERNPNLKLIMYQWDSVRNFDYLKIKDLFDKVYSFDIEDSERYKVTYLPLFYLDDITPFNEEKETVDFLLIASNTKIRYDYYKRLKKLCYKYNLTLYVYLVNPISTIIKDVLSRNLYYNVFDIKLFPMTRRNLIFNYRRSKIFVDITSPLQTGLSMRIIECYGMNKRLISSNTHIASDMYLNEILRIDDQAEDEKILEFLEVEVPEYKNRQKLSINEWLENIFSCR